MLYFYLILILNVFSFVSAIALSEILGIFGNKDCIAGSLVSLNQNNGDKIDNIGLMKMDTLESIDDLNIDKSAMSSINELAQYNDISYSYELIKEEGPPHNKVFTITLYLGNEHYTSEMKSIKKAQQAAASTALKSTNYQHPPIKINENQKSETPVSLLNNLAAKLGLAVTYTLVTDDLLEELSQKDEIDFVPKKSYIQKLNETIHSNDTIHIRKDVSDKGPFTIRVDVNGVKFTGEAHTIKDAKHKAAAKALKSLRENPDIFQCLKEDDNCKTRKQSVKSPISLVYEAAQERKLGVEFEVIDEIGPSHRKLFTTQCTIGDLKATGEGKSKKASKRAAAENILPELLRIPEANGGSQNVALGSQKSKKKNKKNKVIKSTFDKIDRMLDNVVDFGKELVDSIRGKEDSSNDNPKLPKSKGSKSHRSPADEVLQLGNILQLELKYSDYLENGKSYSILDLGTKPSFICLGEGVNQKNSRDLAARYGINKLYKLGLLDNLLDKSMEVSNILDKEENFQNFWLEVVENNEVEKDI